MNAATSRPETSTGLHAAHTLTLFKHHHGLARGPAATHNVRFARGLIQDHDGRRLVWRAALIAHFPSNTQRVQHALGIGCEGAPLT